MTDMPTTEPSLPLAPRDLLILAVLAEEATDASERRRRHRITAEGRTVLRAEVSRLEALLAQARPAIAGDA